jgi:haloalkane dehalogenase
VSEQRNAILELYREPFENREERRAMGWFPRQLPFNGEPREISLAIREYVEFLIECQIPKLFFHATPGLLNPPLLVEWVKTAFPRLTCCDLGVGGHFLPEEQPLKIADALLHWYETNRLAEHVSSKSI